MEDYKPNSHKSKAEAADKHRMQKIVSGKVTVRDNQTGLRAVKDAFIKEDAPSIKKYLLFDILIPAAKKTILELITNGARATLYGSKGGYDNRSSVPAGKVSYSKYYEDQPNRRYEEPRRARITYDDILLPSAGEAQFVLDTMRQAIAEYQVVSVLDYFDMVGMRDQCDQTQDRYGWKDLSNVPIEPVEILVDGIPETRFWLRLPKARPI